MGKKCALKNCKNYQKEPSYGSDISFHGLPKNEEIRQKWLDAIPKNLIRENASNIFICSAHFSPESFQPAALGLTKNMLRRSAIPSMFDDFIEDTTNTKPVVKSEQEQPVEIVKHSVDQINKVNFVNASNTSVYVIMKSDVPLVQSETVAASTGPHTAQKTCDVGVQVSLPTVKERELQRKLLTLQKRLERREARISSMMSDFKTLMDKS